MNKHKLNTILAVISAIMLTAAFGMIMGGGAAGNRVLEISGIIIMGIGSLYWAFVLLRSKNKENEQ
jgi:hypothetical protein